LVLHQFPDVNVLGAYEKPNISNPDDIRVLSVKFSKVGKTTFEKYKNLEWVVCRSHGVDMVNLDECRARNIGVVALSPTAVPCAEWVVSWINEARNVLIFGNGSISREIQKRVSDYRVVDSKTSAEDIKVGIQWADVIVSTIPLTEATQSYFNSGFFQLIDKEVSFVSLSRGEVFDNDALIQFADSGKLKMGIFDMLSSDKRDVLTSKANVKYTEHIAWAHNQPVERGKVGGYVNPQFAQDLKTMIDACLNGKVTHPYIDRREVVWF
jgi:phosphoglycerate dehydrogenase-like enzyme